MKNSKNQYIERNIKADVIRGFAIILVIFGHCIQNGNGWDYFINSKYWSNKVYQFIYSFHMPLFMILAGWFAYFSLKKLEGDRKKQLRFLAKRYFTYIMPILLWTLFEFVSTMEKWVKNDRRAFSPVIFRPLLIRHHHFFFGQDALLP